MENIFFKFHLEWKFKTLHILYYPGWKSNLPQVATHKVIGPLQDPVTWYGINYTGMQITQCNCQNKGTHQSSLTFLCFESPTALFASQCNLLCTMWPDPAKGLLCYTTLNLDLEKSHIFLRVSIDPRRLLNWFHSCSWDEAIFSQGRCFTVCLSMLQSFTLSSQIQFKMCYRCKIHWIDKICLVLASFE